MTNWTQVIARLSASEVHELDGILTGKPEAAQTRIAQPEQDRPMIPDTRIWAGSLGDEVMYLGLRVSAPISHPAAVAGQLAAMAMERAIEPIIFSRIGYTGLERFGFRIEDTSAGGSISSDHLEEQLCQFWDIAVTVDLDQLSALR